MKPVKFDYARAADLAEALALLSRGGEGARPVAGGQSLGPMLNLRVAAPSLLVDISEVPELTEARREGGGLTLGAAICHAHFEDGLGRAETQGLLPRVASTIAYRPVRNRGTIGGSLAHADPGADWPPVLMALGAEVEIAGPTGRRWTGVDSFIVDALSTVLEPGEIVSAVRIPELDGKARWGHRKFCRKPGDFAASLAAVVVDPARRVARAVLAGGAGAPARLPAIEQWLGGSREGALETALDNDLQARAAAERWTDHTASLHRVMMTQAIREAIA